MASLNFSTTVSNLQVNGRLLYIVETAVIKQTEKHCVIFFIHCCLLVLLSFSDRQNPSSGNSQGCVKKKKRLSPPTPHPIAVILAQEDLQL